MLVSEDTLPEFTKVLDDPLIPVIAQRVGVDVRWAIPLEKPCFLSWTDWPGNARSDDEKEVALAGGEQGIVPIHQPDFAIGTHKDVGGVDIRVTRHQIEVLLPERFSQ